VVANACVGVGCALLSVIAIIANFVPAFFMSEGVDGWQPRFYVFPLVIFAIALFQLWLTRKANKQGWTTSRACVESRAPPTAARYRAPRRRSHARA
jgi:surface polysaccharide O-acyltransferase-like enzyme